MKKQLDTKIQLWGATGCLFYIGLLGLGLFVVAGFLVPPHLPTATADAIVATYQSDLTRIRIGMVICMFGCMSIMPFTATMADQLSRIEGRFGILSMTQLLGGMGLAILSFYPLVWWLLASFRPDRSPELILLINDGGWLQFVGGLSLFLPMVLTPAIAAFIDDSETPTFPRWFGYFSLWSVVLYLPGQVIYFFKAGPFAWNGILALWVPVIVFAAWFFVTYFLLRKAIKRQAV